MNVQDCKDFMEKEDCKCVVADEEKIIFTSNKKGIVPMLDMLKLYEEGRIRPVYQADRILGKAAILIAAHCGMKEIYSDVVSQSAMDIGQRKNIKISYQTLVPQILNPLKQKEGPFEAALRDVDEDDFDQILGIIRKTLEKIRAQKV